MFMDDLYTAPQRKCHTMKVLLQHYADIWGCADKQGIQIAQVSGQSNDLERDKGRKPGSSATVETFSGTRKRSVCADF